LNAIPTQTVLDDTTASRAPLYRARLAMPGDANEVIRHYVENLWGISHLQPDAATVASGIMLMIQQRRLFVVERAGQIVGCASYVLCAGYWFTPLEFMYDTGFFIVPRWRKSRAGYVLWELFKAEGRRLGKQIVLGAGTTDPTMLSILSKRYKQIGVAFLVDPHV
jgi:hypothetical protein